MDEAQRKARNTQRMQECHTWFRKHLEVTIKILEDLGFRPRIQDAWRSEEDQLKAFNLGRSKLRYGFHNVTGAQGQKEALAVDLLDDNSPLNPSLPYLLAVAIVANQHRLTTGLTWGLPARLRKPIEAAIDARKFDASIAKVGWDPCHVEVTGVTVAEAKAGRRPED